MAKMFVAQMVLAGLMTGTVAVASGAQVPEKYHWNLADLYATPQAFDAARQQLAKRLPELDANRGKLGGSPAAMKAALDLYFGLAKDLGRIGSYASMRSDEDTRVAEALGARQEVMQLAAEFGSHSSWIAPEVLALPAGAVTKFLKEEPGLAPYRFFLEDLERQRAHTLSQGEEKILAGAGLVSPAATTIYGVLANADLPFPEITLSNGQKVRLDQAAYTRYRALPDRADRILVFREFWRTFEAYEPIRPRSLARPK